MFMGKNIEQTDFKAADYNSFTERLYECLATLRTTIETPGFGEGEITLGAELESYIVDKTAQATPINDILLRELDDSQFQHELNRYNLEYNLSPVPARGAPFTAMGQEITHALAKSSKAAERHQCKIVAIGILPTLKVGNLHPDNMTDVGRYHMLYKGLQKLRGSSFEVNINGEDPLQLTSNHVTLEGANTSLQLHLKVPPDKFADSFNAAQIATPLAIALSANSPTLLGHRLWQETRIALFKQSIDSRHRNDVVWRQPSRVTYGHGWLRKSALELFQETVALYPPIFPILSDTVPQADAFPPTLPELNLHMGTTWPWNRAVYGAGDGGHLRIEMRALPSGPTADDMMANAAFLIGLTMGLRDQMRDVLPSMPFRFSEHNFYRAAQCGLKSRILWPEEHQSQPMEQPITDVILRLLPHMEEGLDMLGVNSAEVRRYRTLVENRVRSGLTGARWQRLMLKYYLEQALSPEESYQAMTLKYMAEQQSGRPVVDWSLSP
tara:strand:+ start:8424 stop:9911 length:1488 start_codon:yes stop_codon:yes gene_type:complete